MSTAEGARNVMLKRLRRMARENKELLDDRKTYQVTPVISFVPGVGSHRKATTPTPTAPAPRRAFRGGRSNSGTCVGLTRSHRLVSLLMLPEQPPQFPAAQLQWSPQNRYPSLATLGCNQLRSCPLSCGQLPGGWTTTK